MSIKRSGPNNRLYLIRLASFDYDYWGRFFFNPFLFFNFGILHRNLPTNHFIEMSEGWAYSHITFATSHMLTLIRKSNEKGQIWFMKWWKMERNITKFDFRHDCFSSFLINFSIAYLIQLFFNVKPFLLTNDAVLRRSLFLGMGPDDTTEAHRQEGKWGIKWNIRERTTLNVIFPVPN